MTSVPAAAPDAARDPHYLRGVALVVLAGCLMSIAGIVVRFIDAADEWQILFYRSIALIATLLLVMALRHRAGLVRAFRSAGFGAVVGGLCLSAGFTGFIFSLTHTTVANTLFVLSAGPFMAALLGWIVLKERVRRATWLAMTAAVFAAAMAATATLAGSGGFAVSGHDLLLCALLGSVQNGAALVIYTIGSRHVPAGELALLLLSEIVLGPIWVWWGVGEVPSALTLVGGVIVLAALGGNAVSGLRRARPPVGVV